MPGFSLYWMMMMCSLRHKPFPLSLCKNAFTVSGSFVREALTSQPSTSEAVVWLQNTSSPCKLSFKCKDFPPTSLLVCFLAEIHEAAPRGQIHLLGTPQTSCLPISPLWNKCEPSDHPCVRRRMQKYGRSHSCFEGEEGSVAALCQSDDLLLQMRSWRASGDVCSGCYPL